jgi:hypothetical protein
MLMQEEQAFIKALLTGNFSPSFKTQMANRGEKRPAVTTRNHGNERQQQGSGKPPR